jgi:hypothetical protein
MILYLQKKMINSFKKIIKKFGSLIFLYYLCAVKTNK